MGLNWKLRITLFVYIHFKDHLNFCLYTLQASSMYVYKLCFPPLSKVKQLRGNSSVIPLHQFGNCRSLDYCISTAAHVQYSHWLSWP